MEKPAPLSLLPTSHILRTYFLTRATSSPLLFRASLLLLKRITQPHAKFLSLEHNFALKWIFRHTFYAQFCAGENSHEVKQKLSSFRRLGYSGSILEYAMESGAASSKYMQSSDTISIWKRGVLDSILAVSQGDFVSLKLSGMGSPAVLLLNKNRPPSSEMSQALTEICVAAVRKGTALLVDAELELTNQGIDSWCLDLQKRFNQDRPVVFSTYQTYLKSTPYNLARNLAEASEQDFILGIKLVRGACLGCENPEGILPSKTHTDNAFNAITEALLRRKYTELIQSIQVGVATLPRFPRIALVIATHNAPSIQKALAIRTKQKQHQEPRIDCIFAQLQGMADDVSCELIMQAKDTSAKINNDNGTCDELKIMKLTAWGSVSDCVQYLFRRAAENQDAIMRAKQTRIAMGKEILRRIMRQ